jgi:hypothetical protein
MVAMRRVKMLRLSVTILIYQRWEGFGGRGGRFGQLATVPIEYAICAYVGALGAYLGLNGHLIAHIGHFVLAISAGHIINVFAINTREVIDVGDHDSLHEYTSFKVSKNEEERAFCPP